MNRDKLLRRGGTAALLAALVLFAAAAGIVVRDLGAFYRSGLGAPLGPAETVGERFYAYELEYELAVFTTVRVATVVEALFYDWRVDFESNGSLVTPFRPARPGMLEVRVTNLEAVEGNLGLTVLQQSGLPPDLETALLNPLLYATVALLVVAAVSFTVGRRPEAAG